MRIPVVSLQLWKAWGFAPASEAEVAEVAGLIGAGTAPDYLKFLRDHGFVEWDIDIPDTFDYRLGAPGQPVLRSAAISHLKSLDVLRKIAADDRRGESGQLPRMIPQGFFPIAGNAGQNEILLELEPSPGRIWYWPERQDPWGTGDNTELGFVADSFTAFVEGLRLEDT